MNSIRFFGFLMVLGLLGATSAQAQNRYFSDGENGLHLQFLAGNGENATSMGGAATVTLDGRFDIGFAYITAAADGRNLLETVEYTPRLGVALTRPDSTSNWSVDLWGTYTWIDSKGDNQYKAGGTVWVVGTDISLHPRGSDGVRFIPTIGFGFGTIDTWLERPMYERSSYNREEFLLGLELGMFIHDLVVVVPQVTFFNSQTVWSISLGLTFNGGEPNR